MTPPLPPGWVEVNMGEIIPKEYLYCDVCEGWPWSTGCGLWANKVVPTPRCGTHFAKRIQIANDEEQILWDKKAFADKDRARELASDLLHFVRIIAWGEHIKSTDLKSRMVRVSEIDVDDARLLLASIGEKGHDVGEKGHDYL
jgi:hypothetical protein